MSSPYPTGGFDEQTQKIMFKAQVTEQALLANAITERCFQDCVVSFRTKELSDKESACINRCADKYLALSRVLSSAYTEEHLKAMKEYQYQ